MKWFDWSEFAGQLFTLHCINFFVHNDGFEILAHFTEHSDVDTEGDF